MPVIMKNNTKTAVPVVQTAIPKRITLKDKIESSLTEVNDSGGFKFEVDFCSTSNTSWCKRKFADALKKQLIDSIPVYALAFDKKKPLLDKIRISIKNNVPIGLSIDDTWLGNFDFSVFVVGKKADTAISGSIAFSPDVINKLPTKIIYKVSNLSLGDNNKNNRPAKITDIERKEWAAIRKSNPKTVTVKGLTYRDLSLKASLADRILNEFKNTVYPMVDFANIKLEMKNLRYHIPYNNSVKKVSTRIHRLYNGNCCFVDVDITISGAYSAGYDLEITFR